MQVNNFLGQAIRAKLHLLYNLSCLQEKDLDFTPRPTWPPVCFVFSVSLMHLEIYFSFKEKKNMSVVYIRSSIQKQWHKKSLQICRLIYATQPILISKSTNFFVCTTQKFSILFIYNISIQQLFQCLYADGMVFNGFVCWVPMSFGCFNTQLR